MFDTQTNFIELEGLHSRWLFSKWCQFCWGHPGRRRRNSHIWPRNELGLCHACSGQSGVSARSRGFCVLGGILSKYALKTNQSEISDNKFLQNHSMSTAFCHSGWNISLKQLACMWQYICPAPTKSRHKSIQFHLSSIHTHMCSPSIRFPMSTLHVLLILPALPHFRSQVTSQARSLHSAARSLA